MSSNIFAVEEPGFQCRWGSFMMAIFLVVLWLVAAFKERSGYTSVVRVIEIAISIVHIQQQ